MCRSSDGIVILEMSFFSTEITVFWCSELIFVGTLSFLWFTEGKSETVSFCTYVCKLPFLLETASIWALFNASRPRNQKPCRQIGNNSRLSIHLSSYPLCLLIFALWEWGPYLHLVFVAIYWSFLFEWN